MWTDRVSELVQLIDELRDQLCVRRRLKHAVYHIVLPLPSVNAASEFADESAPIFGKAVLNLGDHDAPVVHIVGLFLGVVVGGVADKRHHISNVHSGAELVGFDLDFCS